MRRDEPLVKIPPNAPGFLVRVAGLPLAAMTSLSLVDSNVWLERRQALRKQIEAHASVLSACLYSAIANHKHAPVTQKVLLNVRRSIFNQRTLTEHEKLLAYDALSEHNASVMAAWCACHEAYQLNEAQAENAFSEAMREARRALKQIVRDDNLRKGLHVANRKIEHSLVAYLTADNARLNHKLKQTERTLLFYVLRTIHKTSPLGSLTRVAIGQFQDDTEDQGAPVFDAWHTHLSSRPNLALLSRVTRALSKNIALHPQLRLTPVAGWTIADGRVHYRRRTELIVHANTPIHNLVSERSFSMTLSISLDSLLSLFDRHGPTRAADLIDVLVRQHSYEPTQAMDYLQLLINQGLLTIANLRTSNFALDGWKLHCDELANTDDTVLIEIAEALRHIERRAADFSHASIERRPVILDELHHSSRQLLSLAGDTTAPPVTVLYEDALIGELPLQANARPWQSCLEDLADVQRLLSLFDPMLQSRLTLRELFIKRYGAGGRCDDLAEFAEYFHESYYRFVSPLRRFSSGSAHTRQAPSNPLKSRTIDEILEARSAVTHAVERQIDGLGNATECLLPPALLEEFGTQALAWQTLVGLSNAFYAQSFRHGGEINLVINRIYSGSASALLRFATAYPDSTRSEVAQVIAQNAGAHEQDDEVLAEFQGGYETNLNQRPRLSAFELLMPGETPSSLHATPIRFAELSLMHDPLDDHLYLHCSRLGKRIVPVYRGALYPYALPELQLFLLHFGAPPVLRTDILLSSPNATDEIRYQPRLRHRSIVIERARWIVPLSTIPQRGVRDTDYRFACAMHDWRLSHGIPSKVFVTSLDTPLHSTSPGSIGDHTFGRKPVFIDFEQPVCLVVLSGMLGADTVYLIFTELLPGNEDALLGPDGNRYVAEYVFEINQSRRS